MKEDKGNKPDDVDALLQRAASEFAQIPDYLMTRVLNDAETEQTRLIAQEQTSDAGFFAQLREAMGGWAGVSGLAAASCIGFWFGFSPPQSMPDAVDFLATEEAYSSYHESGDVSGFGWDLAGG